MWKTCLHWPVRMGQSSPGTWQSGQQPSKGTRQIPQTSSLGTFHFHTATAFTRFTFTFIADNNNPKRSNGGGDGDASKVRISREDPVSGFTPLTQLSRNWNFSYSVLFAFGIFYVFIALETASAVHGRPSNSLPSPARGTSSTFTTPTYFSNPQNVKVKPEKKRK
jgi:hypothetical protein